MKELINQLLSDKKIVSIRIKNHNYCYHVVSAKTSDDLYVLINGDTVYIAPDQIAIVELSNKNPDPELGF